MKKGGLANGLKGMGGIANKTIQAGLRDPKQPKEDISKLPLDADTLRLKMSGKMQSSHFMF